MFNGGEEKWPELSVGEVEAFLQREQCKIPKTKKIRKSSCPHKDYQSCHVVGLNLLKRMVNVESEWTREITYDAAVYHFYQKMMNGEQNFVCCTEEQNVEDKRVEGKLIQFLLDETPSLDDDAAQKMLSAFVDLLLATQTFLMKTLGTQKSETLDRILSRILRL